MLTSEYLLCNSSFYDSVGLEYTMHLSSFGFIRTNGKSVKIKNEMF